MDMNFTPPGEKTMDVDLTVRLGRLRLKNPVLVASGTWGWGQEYAGLVDPNLLGGLVTKAVTLHPREGNRPPRTAETPCGMLNTIGLANVGVDRFIEEKLPSLQGLQTTVIVNVAGGTQQEYLEVVRRLEGHQGIDALEINISCPNVKQGAMAFGSDPEAVYDLLTAIREATKRFLIVKLSPNVTDIAAVARSAVDAGADALSLINTLVGMAVDVHTWRPRLSTVTGGLSGPAIRPVALAMVWKVAQEVPVPVMGIGGIMNTDDAVEFLLAGAGAVQVGTANFGDPQTPLRIVKGLKEYCSRRAIPSVDQLVGRLAVTQELEGQ
jgi:dihydroorotate dehydrogenase (NAD+) catalytic subunit